jgi:hypothetical protein
MTPWPGRNVSPRRGGDEFEFILLVSPELRWLFGLRRLPPPSSPAFNISCRPWAGRCWACASSWSWLFRRLYINSARNERISLPKLHPLCARLPHAVSQAFTFRTDDLSCDALSTTRVRLDAISRLFPGYVAFRPAVSTNLPSTQHKLSTNSLQTQPFVSLSASAEDELSTQCPSDNQRDRRLMRRMLK